MTRSNKSLHHEKNFDRHAKVDEPILDLGLVHHKLSPFPKKLFILSLSTFFSRNPPARTLKLCTHE